MRTEEEIKDNRKALIVTIIFAVVLIVLAIASSLQN